MTAGNYVGAMLLCACATLAGAGQVHAQEADERATRGAVDGSEAHDWWVVGSGFAFKLYDDSGLDEGLARPRTLVEGSQTTAGVGEVEYEWGPVTFHVGLGLGVTTTRPDGYATLSTSDVRQAPAGVVTAGFVLKLPARWSLRAGMNARRSTTGAGDVTLGLTAEKQF